jgi:hypothetical protein
MRLTDYGFEVPERDKLRDGLRRRGTQPDSREG